MAGSPKCRAHVLSGAPRMAGRSPVVGSGIPEPGPEAPSPGALRPRGEERHRLGWAGGCSSGGPAGDSAGKRTPAAGPGLQPWVVAPGLRERRAGPAHLTAVSGWGCPRLCSVKPVTGAFVCRGARAFIAGIFVQGVWGRVMQIRLIAI